MPFEQIVALIGQKSLKILLILIVGEITKRTITVLTWKIRRAPKKLGKEALLRHQERIKTLSSLVRNSAKIVINFLVLVMIMAELGLNIAPIIAGAGVLGLAVGFGARSLVSDLIAGFFLILEGQVNVGDEIQIGSHQGRIRKMTLRTITLKDKAKKVYFIPNSAIKTIIKFPKKDKEKK